MISYKSVAPREINRIKIIKRFVILSGIILFIIPGLVGIIIDYSPNVFGPIAKVFVLCAAGCFVYATNIMKFRFKELKDEYVAFSVSLLWTSNTYRLYFDEIDAADVNYSSRTADFRFTMKYGIIKMNIWGFGDVYHWLFPVLDRLYEKCDLRVGDNPRILMIKKWFPPGQSEKIVKETWYEKANKKLWLIVIVLVIIWIFINWWFLER